jgi:hypothetical protein
VTYHRLLQELITEVERSAHKPQQRLTFMSCLAMLLPQLGLYSVRHFSRLMPLLLEWTHAFDIGAAGAGCHTSLLAGRGQESSWTFVMLAGCAIQAACLACALLALPIGACFWGFASLQCWIALLMLGALLSLCLSYHDDG